MRSEESKLTRDRMHGKKQAVYSLLLIADGKKGKREQPN
jgi:hypothetical protein